MAQSTQGVHLSIVVLFVHRMLSSPLEGDGQACSEVLTSLGLVYQG